jgi:hypothetical protein
VCVCGCVVLYYESSRCPFLSITTEFVVVLLVVGGRFPGCFAPRTPFLRKLARSMRTIHIYYNDISETSNVDVDHCTNPLYTKKIGRTADADGLGAPSFVVPCSFFF